VNSPRDWTILCQRIQNSDAHHTYKACTAPTCGQGNRFIPVPHISIIARRPRSPGPRINHPHLAKSIGRNTNQHSKMASSEGEPRKRQRFRNLLKSAKSIFNRRKRSTLSISASSPSGATAVAVEIAQQRRASASNVKSVKDDSEAVAASSPPSSSNALTSAATEEEGTTTQTEIPVVETCDVQGVTGDVGGSALTTDAHDDTRAEPIQEHGMRDDVVSSDTIRTIERYKKAIERITKALELRRDTWETFELSGFESLPLGGEQDISNLQLQIDKVLESRLNASKNRTTWGKSKHILEQCFRALAPFTKNALSVAVNAAQVSSTQHSLRLTSRSPFSIHTGCYLEASCCSSRYIFKASNCPNARSRNMKLRLLQISKRQLITSADKWEDSGLYIIFPAKPMEFHRRHLKIGAWTSSLRPLITFLFI